MSSKAKQPGRLVRRPPASGRKPSRHLKVGDIATIGDELIAFHREYHSVFQRREQRHCSMFYLCGQLSGLARKTIEPMVMALDGADLNAIRALLQFMGQSPWSAADAMQQHQRLVAETLGDPLGVVIVDGSGFPKQGPYSAGVGYQYCGHLGTLANCQEGTFAVYAIRHGYTFLDARLYVPEHWFDTEHKRYANAVGYLTRSAFRLNQRWRSRWSRTCTRRASSPFAGSPGMSISAKTRPFWTGSPPWASGILPKCRATPVSGCMRRRSNHRVAARWAVRAWHAMHHPRVNCERSQLACHALRGNVT